MKRVILVRDLYDKTYTLGTLMVYDGPLRVFTSRCLERPWTDNKPKVSCVPAGTFPIVLEFSPAFKRELWELKDVPNRSEAKVHPANYVRQLLGCIAPGLSVGDIDHDGLPDMVSSAEALKRFMAAMGTQRVSTIGIIGDGRDMIID